MQVFLSYSWKNSDSADLIEKMCKSVGIQLIRDKYDLRYSENIKSFAEKIVQCEFVICLISGSYFKSYRCMYEAAILMKNPDYSKKLCCVVVSPINSDIIGRIESIKYWEDRIKKIQQEKRKVKITSRKSISKDLNDFNQIEQCIGEFIRYIDDNKYVTIEDIKEGGISTFIDTIVRKIGIKPEIHIQLLSRIADNGDLQEQEKMLMSYYEKYNANEYYYFVRAYIYEQHDYNELALIYYKLAIETNPQYIIGYEAVINILLSSSKVNMDEVQFFLNKLLLLDSTLSCIDRIKGEIEMSNGNYQEAIKNYMRYIEKEPGDYAVYNSIGSAYAQSLDEEDIKLSKTNYEKALTINPNYYQCYNNLAIWYLKFKKDYYQAIDFSNKCLSINTNYYYSYNVRGLAYIELGEYEKAFDDLCTSIRLSPPEHYLPMTNMGYLIEKGFADYRVSKLFYIALKKIGDVNAFVALANQIFKVEQDLDSAMKIANEVLQISPDNILMIFLKAMIYFEKHELITACDLCDKCIELENTYWPAYFLKIYMQDENLYDVKYKNLPIEIKKDIKECFDELNKTYENKNYKYIYEYIRQQYNYLSKATVQRKNYIKLKNGLEEFGQELTF